MKRRLISILALGGLGVILAGGLVELAFFLAGTEFTASFHTPEADRGWGFRAGAEGWSLREGSRHWVRINARGERDRDHELRKPLGTLRIAVLGDSFSAALEVAAEDAYWSVLERELAGCSGLAGQAVEVLNFGVSGYSTAQEVVTLQTRASTYEPDMVVLQMFAGNDLADNVAALDGRQEPAPYFVHRNTDLVLDDSLLRTPKFSSWRIALSNQIRELVNRSRLLLFLYDSAKRWSGARPPSHSGPPGGSGPRIASGNRYIFSPPATPETGEAWRIAEDVLTLFANEVRRHGAEPWILMIPMPSQVHPDRAAKDTLARELGVSDLFYPDRRIGAHAERIGVSFVGLAPTLAEHAEETGEYLHGFPAGRLGNGHWNERGHRLGGEILAERICLAASERLRP